MRFISKLGRVELRRLGVGEAGVTGIGASGRSLFGSTRTVAFCAGNKGTHSSKKPNTAFAEECAHDPCIGFSPLLDPAATLSPSWPAIDIPVAATTKVVHATNQTELLEVGVTFTADCSRIWLHRQSHF